MRAALVAVAVAVGAAALGLGLPAPSRAAAHVSSSHAHQATTTTWPVRWPFWRATKGTRINPYAPRGRYRGGSALPARRCTTTGTPGPDMLHGMPGKDVICSLGGNDVIDGRGGADTIDGGAGNDTIDGGARADVLIGGAGSDTIRGDGGDDGIFGKAGDDRLSGGSGLDRIYASTGGDLVHGGRGPDQIVGEPGGDRLAGDAGDDTIVSHDGIRDRVDGGPGTDRALDDVRSRGSRHAAHGAGAADRLTHIEATGPAPLAVGQSCQFWYPNTYIFCQSAGAFGNVTENERVTFQASALWQSIDLSYVGLHGDCDGTSFHSRGQTQDPGLGAGHWGSDCELEMWASSGGSSGGGGMVSVQSITPTS